MWGRPVRPQLASMFGRDHNIMKLDKVKSGVAYVHYIRQDDNSRWGIKCKLIGNQVLWASDNPDSIGRWRDDPMDSVVKYSISGGDLTVTETYSDGSSTKNTYPIKQL